MNFNNAYHRIKFFSKQVTRDDYGASSDQWDYSEPTIVTRGEIRYTGGSKGLSNEEKFYSKFVELIVRYRSTIVETMRIQIDGTNDLWGISSTPEVLGRNEGIRMTIEKLADSLSDVLISPPSDLIVTSLSENSIGITWVNNATAGIVFERTETGNKWEEIKRIQVVDMPVVEYTDEDLIEGTRYFYRARHFVYANYSAYSNVDDAMPMPVGSMAIRNFWVGTQAEYDGLGAYDDETLYVIQD